MRGSTWIAYGLLSAMEQSILNSSKQTRLGETTQRGIVTAEGLGDNPLRTLCATLARVFVAIAIILPANFVHADTVDEAALRLS